MLFIFILLEVAKWFAQKKGIMFNNAAFTVDYAPSQILHNLVLLQSWLPGANPLFYNYVSWSISVEYYMYIILAFIMFWIPKKKEYLLLSILAFIALFFHSDVLKQEALRGLSCFFAGCLCYLVYLRISKIIISQIIFDLLELISIAAIIISNFTYKVFELKGIALGKRVVERMEAKSGSPELKPES